MLRTNPLVVALTNGASLEMLPKAETTAAPRAFFVSSSAPEEVWATTRSLFGTSSGNEQVTMTFRHLADPPQHVVDAGHIVM
jgi:hypothetical protein